MRYENLEQFEQHHENLGYRILKYVDEPRRNYVLLREGRDALDPRYDYGLAAGSPFARILLARATAKHWNELGVNARGPFYFVTFFWSRYAFAVDDFDRFDSKSHQAEITNVLRDHSFIGMTEIAYYPRWRKAPNESLGPIVSAHSHIITMGSSRSELEDALMQASAESSLVPNVSAVDIRGVGRDHVLEKLLYAEKQPHRTYAPWTLKTPRERVSKTTGEVFQQTHKHKKDDMRPGELIKAVNLLCGRYLDDLMFGNGVGMELATAIVGEARRRLDAEELKLRRRRETSGLLAEQHRQNMALLMSARRPSKSALRWR